MQLVLFGVCGRSNVAHKGPNEKDKYRLKRKERNKSREEIFYQMKGFFCFDQLYEMFFVNRPGAYD